MKPVSLDLAASAKHSAVERQNGWVDVIHGQGVINSLALLAKRCEMTARRIPCPGFKLVAVRQHAALWSAGGPGRIKHACLTRGGHRVLAPGARRRRKVCELL